MDDKTHDFYAENAATCALRWDGLEHDAGLAPFFANAFRPRGRVLDVGCGSGRQVRTLHEHGFDAYGIEPVDALRDQLVERHPGLADVIATGSLPDLTLPLSWPHEFDGIVCEAVLMHVPESDLVGALKSLRGYLASEGRLLISVPSERPGITEQRDLVGRLFTGISIDELEAFSSQVGFTFDARWRGRRDAQARQGHSWDVLQLRRR